MQAEIFDTSCQLSKKNLLYCSSSTHVSSLRWGRENEDKKAYTEEMMEERHTCHHKKKRV